MKNIINELWHGNIIPGEDSRSMSRMPNRTSIYTSPTSATLTAYALTDNPRKIKQPLKSTQQKRTDDLKSSVLV